jgi:hypothetical protein
MVNHPIDCLPVAPRLPETRRREAASQNLEPRPACGGREGVWTLLTSLTWLTSLTADFVDVIWEIFWGPSPFLRRMLRLEGDSHFDHHRTLSGHGTAGFRFFENLLDTR